MGVGKNHQISYFIQFPNSKFNFHVPVQTRIDPVLRRSIRLRLRLLLLHRKGFIDEAEWMSRPQLPR